MAKITVFKEVRLLPNLASPDRYDIIAVNGVRWHSEPDLARKLHEKYPGLSHIANLVNSNVDIRGRIYGAEQLTQIYVRIMADGPPQYIAIKRCEVDGID